jgi:hypothetical protein
VIASLCVKYHAIETYGERRKAPCILNVGTHRCGVEELALLLCVGVSQVQVWAQRPAALTSGSCLSSQFLQAFSGTVPKVRPRPLPSI